MTLDKAIEIKLQWRKDNYPPALADEIDADNISIEALKRVAKMRTYKPTPPGLLLPGETQP